MKRTLVSLLLALALVLGVNSVVLADSPTEVDFDWDGSGWIGGVVTAGDDAVHSFESFGTMGNIGNFYSKDSNDNPYTYGVDSCVTHLDTAISGYGWAFLQSNRNDAKTSYGQPGQISLTGVEIDGGSATLSNRSTTNYASMRDCNYGWNANDHVTVTGSSAYEIMRYMDSGYTNFAGINAFGSGDADLDCMNAEASEGRVRLGLGCGCYTNAKFNASGTGTFGLHAEADTEITSALAPGVTGMTTFDFIASWASSIGIADYSTTAD